MPGEGQLEGRREDPDSDIGVARGRRQHEHRLGQAHLPRQRLHRQRVEIASVGEDGELVPGEGHVGDDVAEAPHDGNLPWLPCLPTGRWQRISPSSIRHKPLGGPVEGHSHDKDTRMLHALGYAQELRRGMSGFSNFAISFTIISILYGTLTLYYQGINYGGPVEEAYGWPLVSVFVIIVGLGMAEIASKYPTAGGLYYWASKMGGAGWGWFTGWFNLIGQIAITAGIDYGAAVFADALLGLLWGGTFHGTQHEIIYVYAC